MSNLLGIPDEKLDIDKYKRQLKTGACVISTYRKGIPGATVLAAGGFGKTILGILLIKKLCKMGKFKVIVIVPSTQLKEQWIEEIKTFNLDCVEVRTIHSSHEEGVVCDFLILDEFDMYQGINQSKIYEKSKYSWLLQMSGTSKRLDGREKIGLSYAPIVDIIPEEECVKNKWISDFTIYNIPVYLTKEERLREKSLTKLIAKHLSNPIFNGNIQKMKACMTKEVSQNVIAEIGNYSNDVEYQTQVDILIANAATGSRAIDDRLAIYYDSEEKMELTVELLNRKLKGFKTIVFSQSTKFSDKLSTKVENSVMYHSNVTTRITVDDRVIAIGVNTKIKRKKVLMYRLISDDLIYSYEDIKKKYPNCKKVGKDKLKKLALQKFKDNEVDKIITAKTLEQGFSVDDLQIGVEVSRTRNPRNFMQKTWRLSRKFYLPNGKMMHGIFICLYIKGTRDEQAMRESQVNARNIIELETIFELPL